MANELKFRLALEGQAAVVNGLDQVSDRVEGVGRSAGSATTRANSMVDTLTRAGRLAIAGGGLAVLLSMTQAVGGALFTASVNAQRLETQLNFASGGNSAKEMAFVTSVANRLGLELNATAQAYAGFLSAAKGTSLEGANSRRVFESIAQASAVMGLSTDQASGALLAIQQMMSKGVVSAEEFRGQLGERMPIALQAGANALGVTTAEFSKMLESGQIVAADFLPRFAVAIKEMLGDSVENAANRLEGNTARMGTAWERFKRTVGDAGVSQAMANEAQGISNYLNGVADAMDNAKASGAGFMSQLSIGTGFAIGRAGFETLFAAGNLLNGTLNLLTLNAFGLNTNINLLPDAFKTNAQRAAELEGQLKTAETVLATLQERLKASPDNIYLKSETYQAFLYAEELRAAKKAKDDLNGGGAGRGSVNPQTVEQMGKAQSLLADAMEQYALKGEKANKVIEALRKTHGALFTPEMEKRVRDQLNPPTKGISDATKGLNLYNDLTAKSAGLNADFSEKWALLAAAFSTGKINLDQLTLAQRELLKTQPAAQEAAKAWEEQTKASNKAVADSIKEYDRYVDGLTASAQAVGKQVQKLEDEEKARALAVAQNISLAQAIELVTIKRREEQLVIERKAGNQEALDAIKEEIKNREKLVDLLGNQEQRDAGLRSAKATADEWKRGWEETDRLGRETFTNMEGAAVRLGDTLKKALASAIYEVTLKPIMFQLYASVTGGGGAAGSAVQSGLNSTAGNGLSSMLGNISIAGSSLSAISSSVATGVQAGWAGTSISAAAEAYTAAGMTGVSTGLTAGSAIGSTAASISAGVSSALAAIPGWGWAAMAVLAIANMKGTYVQSLGETVATVNADRTVALGGSGGNNDVSIGGGLNIRQTEVSDKFVNGIASAFVKAAAQLGISASGATFGAGFNDSDGGKFAVEVTAGGKKYDPGQAKYSDENLALEASRAVFFALQSSDLPGYLSKVFDGITASTAAQADIDAALNYASGLKQIRDALTETREPLQILKDTVADSLKALGTSADTFKLDFVAAIDAGISPEKLAEYQQLGVNLDALAQSTGTAKEATDRLAATNQSWTDKLDLLTGKETERSLALRDATDDSTRAIMRQVYAQEDLAKAVADSASSAQRAAGNLMSTMMDEFDKSIGNKSVDISNGIDRLFARNAETAQMFREATTDGTKALQAQYFSNGGGTYSMDTTADQAANNWALMQPASQSLSADLKAWVDMRQMMTDTDTKQAQNFGMDNFTGGGSAAPDTSARDAANALASERKGLQDQLDELLLSVAEKSARAREAIGEENRALFDQLEQVRASKTEAEEAAKSLDKFNGAMRGLTDTNTDLQAQLLKLQGDEAGAAKLLRNKALAALTQGVTTDDAARLTAQYDANEALKTQIEGLTKAQQDAASSAANLKSTWTSIATGLMKEVDRIRGVMAESSTDSLAALQSRFAIANAQTRAGDLTAAGNLTSYSGQLSSAITEQAGSRNEMVRLQAQLAQSLQDTAIVLGAPVSPVNTPPVINTEKLEASIATLSAKIVLLEEQLSAINTNTKRGADAADMLVAIAP